MQGQFKHSLKMVALVAGITSCATEPLPRPVALDPSNPAGVESRPSDVTSLAGAGAPPADAEAANGATGGEHEPEVYTCPMHADVTSDKPGRCPKCGMDLVPKKVAEKAGAMDGHQ